MGRRSEFAPDLLIYHPKSLASPQMAERLGVPSVLASPLPGFTPTTALPSPMLPFSSLGPFNRLSHAVVLAGSRRMFRGLVDDWRPATLDLGPSRTPRAPVASLYGYSRHVVPRPDDFRRTSMSPATGWSRTPIGRLRTL
jgi:sterol 3beta-glucosyltransferase